MNVYTSSINLFNRDNSVIKWHPTQKLLFVVSKFSDLVYELKIYDYEQEVTLSHSTMCDILVTRHNPFESLTEIDIHPSYPHMMMVFSDNTVSTWDYSSGSVIAERTFNMLTNARFLLESQQVGLLEKDELGNAKYSNWNYENDEYESYFLEIDEYYINNIAFHPSYMMFIATYANTSDETGLWLYDMLPHQQMIWCFHVSIASEIRANYYNVSFSPNGRYVAFLIDKYAVENENTIKITKVGIFDLITKKEVSNKLIGNNIPTPLSLFFSSNDVLICVLNTKKSMIMQGDGFLEEEIIELNMEAYSNIVSSAHSVLSLFAFISNAKLHILDFHVQKCDLSNTDAKTIGISYRTESRRSYIPISPKNINNPIDS